VFFISISSGSLDSSTCFNFPANSASSLELSNKLRKSLNPAESVVSVCLASSFIFFLIDPTPYPDASLGFFSLCTGIIDFHQACCLSATSICSTVASRPSALNFNKYEPGRCGATGGGLSSILASSTTN